MFDVSFIPPVQSSKFDGSTVRRFPSPCSPSTFDVQCSMFDVSFIPPAQSSKFDGSTVQRFPSPCSPSTFDVRCSMFDVSFIPPCSKSKFDGSTLQRFPSSCSPSTFDVRCFRLARRTRSGPRRRQFLVLRAHIQSSHVPDRNPERVLFGPEHALFANRG